MLPATCKQPKELEFGMRLKNLRGENLWYSVFTICWVPFVLGLLFSNIQDFYFQPKSDKYMYRCGNGMEKQIQVQQFQKWWYVNTTNNVNIKLQKTMGMKYKEYLGIQ